MLWVRVPPTLFLFEKPSDLRYDQGMTQKDKFRFRIGQRVKDIGSRGKRSTGLVGEVVERNQMSLTTIRGPMKGVPIYTNDYVVRGKIKVIWRYENELTPV
jgi:hypothetical protein